MSTILLMPSINYNIKLDVDPRRDDDASPMSSYGCMFRFTDSLQNIKAETFSPGTTTFLKKKWVSML